LSAQSSSLAGALLKKVIITFVVLVCVTIILAIALTLEMNDDWMERLTATSAICALCFGIFVATGAVMRRRKIALTMWISSILTLVGTFLAVVLIWGDQNQQLEEVARFTFISFILGIGLAHSGVMSIVSTHTRLLFFTKFATFTSVWICAILSLTILWYEEIFDSFGGFFWTFLPFYMLSILASIVGTIIVPIAAVSHANKTAIAHESIASRVKLLLECPKCAARQELSCGNVRCSNCKASIFIEIEESRCECGYLLYQLQGDVCPECGRMIRESEKWEPTPVGIDLATAKPDVK